MAKNKKQLAKFPVSRKLWLLEWESLEKRAKLSQTERPESGVVLHTLIMRMENHEYTLARARFIAGALERINPALNLLMSLDADRRHKRELAQRRLRKVLEKCGLLDENGRYKKQLPAK